MQGQEQNFKQPMDTDIGSLNEKGFVRLEDPTISEDILKLEKNGFQFWTEDGLDFCIQHVLHQAVSYRGPDVI